MYFKTTVQKLYYLNTFLHFKIINENITREIQQKTQNENFHPIN